MDDDDRILLRILAEERHAAELVMDLVRQGFDVDDALSLVRFPYDDA